MLIKTNSSHGEVIRVTSLSKAGNKYWYVGPEKEYQGKRCVFIQTIKPKSSRLALVRFIGFFALVKYTHLRKRYQYVQALQQNTELQSNARFTVSHAIEQGIIKRGTLCELCGIDTTIPLQKQVSLLKRDRDYPRIVGHHWKGYEYPLSVWWICLSCNTRLIGYHDGGLTKEDAQNIINRK